MHKVFVLYKEGKIKPVVDSVFTFEDVYFVFFFFSFIYNYFNYIDK
jgi:hypothetical protein